MINEDRRRMSGTTEPAPGVTTTASFVERILRLSQFDSWAARRRAVTIATIWTGLAIIAIPTLFLVAFYIPDPVANVTLVLAGFGCYAVMLVCLRHGRVSTAAWLLVGYFVVVPIVGSLISNDVQASPMFVPLTVIVAACMLPPRQVVFAGFLAFAQLGALALIGQDYPISVSDLLTWAAVALLLVATAAVVMSLAITRALAAADASRARAEALAADLSVTNVELENRVADRTRELREALQREQALSARLSELTVRDPLTGLHNRRYLEDEFPRLLSAAERHHEPLSVAAIDLDNFKSINDEFSHAMGDEVLQTTAHLMLVHSRASDVLVRMGGEEFALLMPGATTEDARAVCERMRSAIATYDWVSIQTDLAVTASFGVTTSDGLSAGDDVLRAADIQLYRAKRAGKNVVKCGVA